MKRQWLISKLDGRRNVKLRWTEKCVLALTGVKNDGADSNDSTFTIRDTKFNVPVVTLFEKDNQKL